MVRTYEGKEMKEDDDDIQEYEYNRKYIRHQLEPREPTRNEVLEEVAKEIEKLPFGDTASSFAIFVRGMKR